MCSLFVHVQHPRVLRATNRRRIRVTRRVERANAKTPTKYKERCDLPKGIVVQPTTRTTTTGSYRATPSFNNNNRRSSIILIMKTILFLLPTCLCLVKAFQNAPLPLPKGSITNINDPTRRIYRYNYDVSLPHGGVRLTTSAMIATAATATQRMPMTTRLYATGGGGESSSSGNSSSNNPQRRRNFLRQFLQKIIAWQVRIRLRYDGLSKRAKRIVLIQALIVACLFGSVTRNVVQRNHYMASSPPPVEIAYSSFLDMVEQQDKEEVPLIDHVRIGTDRISYRLYKRESNNPPLTETVPPSPAAAKRGTFFKNNNKQQKLLQSSTSTDQRPSLRAYTRKVPASPELVSTLRENQIKFAALAQPRNSLATSVRTLMIGFYFAILWRLYGTMASAGGNSKKDVPGKLAQTSDLPMATFDEIQGIDGAKTEVMELVDTLRNPDKYAILGARAPTGLLLEGPPGVGKTLLARATAASAGVPLLYCSGSDFVEMFVGRGAARIRKLFERAAKLSPCLIFVDELDALGKSRDMGGMAGGFSRSNDEAEQTLNQLLACMDGLDSSRRVCVMAATNRKEVLDPALIRPGRFDRIVSLKLPDSAGREKILRVHCKKLPGFVEGQGVDPTRPGSLGKGRVVDLSAIASVTDGFSGAELEFIVNEAAIRAVRRVSAALRENTSGNVGDIVPHVEAADFETSLSNFYETRRNKRPGELLKSLWK